MGFLDALQASASGLSAQRVRMRLIANNLANMHTTRTPEGGPYQRREPIFAAESPDGATFHDMLKAQQEGGVVEVRTVDIIKDGRDPIPNMNRTTRTPTRRGLFRCRISA
jgi:flagellar basal-body rod protein FlgC